MTIEEVIKSLNKFISDYRITQGIKCKSFLVAHKVVLNASETFKAMKSYDVFINIVKQGKEPITLYRFHKIVNSAVIKQEEAYNTIASELLQNILFGMKDGSLEEVINGTYKSKLIEHETI